MSAIAPLDRLITQNETARRLGVPIGGVRRLIKSGRIETATNIAGGYATVVESSVDRLVEQLRPSRHPVTA